LDIVLCASIRLVESRLVEILTERWLGLLQVAAAREKSIQRGQLERSTAIAYEKVARKEQNAAKVLATEEVNSLLGKYHMLGAVNGQRHVTGSSDEIGTLIQTGAPDSYTKELERAAKSAREQMVGVATASVAEAATARARDGTMTVAAESNHKAKKKSEFLAVDLEQAWAGQVSHRFGLVWSMKHDHSVVNPTMMEGVSDSCIHALWEHSSKTRSAARMTFVQDMLVRPDVAPARGAAGGSALIKLEMQVARSSHTEGKPMELSDIMSMVSEASVKGNSWAFKHSNPDGEWAERMAEAPPDPEIPDFLKHDDREFTRLELSRRPLVPSVSTLIPAAT
jgi:hypothetical protein